MTPAQALTQAKHRHAAGDLRAAEPLYRQVLAAHPDHPEALNMLGLVALQCGHPGPAVELMERSVALNGDVFFFHNNLAEAYKAAGRYADAAAAFERSLQLNPDDPETAHSMGVALERAGQVDRAIDVLQGVIARAPQLAKAHLSLGAILEHRARYDQALAHYEQAVTLKPDYARARAARAALWLRSGDFARGWDEYEWRWRVEKFPGRPPRPGVPLWDGSDLAGQRILLFAEQGLGDTIQFVRYATTVARRGGHVIVECPKSLVRLAQTVDGVREVVATDDDPPPAYDVQCPILSLPRVLGTRLETIPVQVPYVSAPPDVVDLWRTRLPADPAFKVGLCWAGGRSQPHRSLRAADLVAPLVQAFPNVRFFSLQKDRPADDPEPPPGLIDEMPAVTDFADTAALVDQLDLIISIDTAVAHLAGALAKPTWLLLPRDADWRWLESRDDSPWYPTARLFRQPTPGDWRPVLDRLTAELKAWSLQ